jgi:hypothetical protein
MHYQHDVICNRHGGQTSKHTKEWMCACNYECVHHVGVYACMHVVAYITHTNVCIYVCMCVRSVYVRTYVRTYVCTYVCMYVCRLCMSHVVLRNCLRSFFFVVCCCCYCCSCVFNLKTKLCASPMPAESPLPPLLFPFPCHFSLALPSLRCAFGALSHP